MLTSRVCEEFATLWRIFPDDLKESKDYNFNSSMLKKHCPDRNCNNDIDKIHAGCLWLFNQFYGNIINFTNKANENINLFTYIMTWISYKLNQKPQIGINKFNDFYSNHMQNVEEYKTHIDGVTKYTSYIDLIDKKQDLMSININDMSEFYDAFKILCNMINNSSKIEIYLKHAEEFVSKHKELIENSSNIQGNSYNKMLSILSDDYTNYGKSTAYSDIRNKLPELTKEKKKQMHVSSSEISPSSSENEVSNYDSTSPSNSETEASNYNSTSPSSSLVNKLISIPLIFIATLIFLGIAYKYSLFGFRKRPQKHLREKLKK
ncbi:hypothetical protein YYC_05066, partial [Plasmodium yoelii 17X]|uniref:PIR protein n=3 Tax=Plasmodium yoelii TaxID=5861 RepID=A0AAE9WJJ8_PLAYO|eukprot:XP_022811499.1 PIR protein [Plasmodium yoelii]